MSGADPAMLLGILVLGALLIGAAVVAVKGFAGFTFGTDTEYDRVAKQLIRDGNEFASLLESVHDVSSAEAVSSRVQVLVGNFQSLKLQIDTMPKPSKLEDAKLGLRYDTEIKALIKRMQNGLSHVQSIPGALDALRGSLAPLRGFEIPPPPVIPRQQQPPFQPPTLPGPPSQGQPGPPGPGSNPGFQPPRFQPPTFPQPPRFQPPTIPRPPRSTGPRMGRGRGIPQG
jgi:hypothetical protein